MSNVVVINHVTLDGVMQAPGRAGEDLRGGFEHGGWAIPGNDAVMGRVMGEGMAQSGSLLLGRRTYEAFYAFWPNQRDNPFTEVLNNVQKYVASATLKEPLPWSNSTRQPPLGRQRGDNHWCGDRVGEPDRRIAAPKHIGCSRLRCFAARADRGFSGHRRAV